MNGGYVLAGVICFILAGLTGADFISTSISADGSAMLSSIGYDEYDSHSSRVMTSDESEIIGSLAGSDSLESDLSVRGSGPILVSEFTTNILKGAGSPIACSFIELKKDLIPGRSDMYTSGILNQGSFQASRSAGESLLGSTEINGTGMVIFGSQNQGNRTWKSRGFAVGNLTIRDLVKYGGRV